MPKTPCTPVSRQLDLPFVPSDNFADSIGNILSDVKQLLIAEHPRFAGMCTVDTSHRIEDNVITALPEDRRCMLLAQRPDEEPLAENEETHLAVETASEISHISSEFEQVLGNVKHSSTDRVVEDLRAIFASNKSESSATLAEFPSRFHRFLNHARENPLMVLDDFMPIVIILNVVTVAISCDTSEWPGWAVVDIIFLLCFLTEFVVKFLVLGRAGYFCGMDWKWHWFECLILGIAIVEVVLEAMSCDGISATSSFRLFRLLRLSKLTRMFKLSYLSEMLTMIHGIIGGAKTLFFSVILITMPLFMLSMILRETLGREREAGGASQMFSSLPMSFFTLFRCVVATDCSDEDGRPIFLHVSARYGWMYAFIYGSTIVLMTFGLFNVIVAVYVENTVAAANYHDHKKAEKRWRDQELLDRKTLEIATLIYSYKTGTPVADILHNGMDFEELKCIALTQVEFFNVCASPLFSRLLSDLDVSKDHQKELFGNLDFDHKGTLDIGQIVTGIVKHRGGARKADIVEATRIVRNIETTLAEFREETLAILKLNSRIVMKTPFPRSHSAIGDSIGA